MGFGTYIRERREELATRDGAQKYSMRNVARRIGVEPSYLSKVEREQKPPPSETTIVSLAAVLHEDPDLLLCLAGKLPRDVRDIVAGDPTLFCPLIRRLSKAEARGPGTLKRLLETLNAKALE